MPLFAQDDNDYVMYQTINLKPKAGQFDKLREGIKAHNEAYHKEGDQLARVWTINSGPNSGSMSWVMGPLTWTTFDKQMTDDHLTHWMDNIGAYADMGEWGYWRLADGLSYAPEGFQPTVMRIRYFEINERKGNNAREIIQKLIDVYRAENFDVGIHVFNNQAEWGDGKNWAVLWQHKNWASMDQNRKLKEKFEAMHGEDSWTEFFETWNEATNWKGTELNALAPELSGNAN